MARDNKEIKYLYKEELNRLFNTIKKSNNKYATRNMAIFHVAYYCALRASEVGLLKIEDYNSIKNELYCKRLKGSFNNTLRLNKITAAALKKYINQAKPEDILFSSRENNPISRQMLDRLMKKYCASAGIKDRSKWHFHSLKHSRAVHLAEQGLDIKEVQYWLGHKEVNNTMIYFQFTSSQQEELYRKLSKKEDY